MRRRITGAERRARAACLAGLVVFALPAVNMELRDRGHDLITAPAFDISALPGVFKAQLQSLIAYLRQAEMKPLPELGMRVLTDGKAQQPGLGQALGRRQLLDRAGVEMA